MCFKVLCSRLKKLKIIHNYLHKTLGPKMDVENSRSWGKTQAVTALQWVDIVVTSLSTCRALPFT